MFAFLNRLYLITATNKAMRTLSLYMQSHLILCVYCYYNYYYYITKVYVISVK
jgi:hypothetical protein